MKILHYLVSALACCTLINCKKSEVATPVVKQHRAILYFDSEQKFRMDYEGTGYRQFSSQDGDSIEFKAMHLNNWTDKDIHDEKWVDASFQGTMSTSGEDTLNVQISVKVNNQVPFEIQTLGITPKGSQSSSDPVSHPFAPGQHELLIEGQVTDLYDKQ
ncbi:MAG: hypothetical protein RIS79_153 [Verrucomicrobiota bacterium]|jgi:hypothetical protein